LFDELISFAFKLFSTITEGRDSKLNKYILYLFVNSLKELISKMALKGVFRKSNANNEIKEFYKDINKTLL